MNEKSMYEELLSLFGCFGTNIEKIEKSDIFIMYISVPKTLELRTYETIISGNNIVNVFKSLLVDIIGGLFDDIKIRYKIREDDWSKDDTTNRIKLQVMQENMNKDTFIELMNKLSEQINKE